MRNAVLLLMICMSLGLWGQTLLEYRVISENVSSDNIVEFYAGDDSVRFFSEGEQGSVDLICTQDMNTMRYVMKSNEDSLSLIAQRNDDGIAVSKVDDNGKEYKLLEYNGELPWYQSFHYQFSDFALSGEKKRKFVMIRPDNLTLSEWQVVNKGKETVSTPAGDIEAVRVKVSLGGFLSAFWSAECWYRVSDGRFVKYTGPSGPPGSPEITTVLKSEKQG